MSANAPAVNTIDVINLDSSMEKKGAKKWRIQTHSDPDTSSKCCAKAELSPGDHAVTWYMANKR